MALNSRLLGIALDSLWPLLQAGIAFTIPLTLLSFLCGLAFGFLIALARSSPSRAVESVARFYVWIFRGTPLLVQLFLIFYGLPNLGIPLNAFPAALIGFSMNVGAYNSETIRAAIGWVPRGQWDTACALGMNGPQVFGRIVLGGPGRRAPSGELLHRAGEGYLPGGDAHRTGNIPGGAEDHGSDV